LNLQQAIADQKAHPQLVVKEEPQPIQEEGEPGADGAKKRSNKPREKGPIFKVHGCGINARTMSIAVDELEPLGIMIPPEEVERKKWKLELKVKNALFDVDWGQDDDTKLLLAVWEYGMGNWDKILESDPVLKEKIFLEGEKKPLVKHASSRVDYLLRVMKKHVAVQKLKQPKLKKKKEPKAKVKKESGVSIAVGVDGIAVAALPNADGVSANAAGASGANKGNKKEKKKRGRKKKDDMPKHFAAGAEPTPVSILGDLDPTVFNECKEKMRPVKKALKSLDTRDPAAIETKEFQTQFKECLLQIGRQIDACLKEYEKEEKDKCKLWKRYVRHEKYNLVWDIAFSIYEL
jgi:chromodomain-helicase-DNA-binding protein 1